MDIFTSVNSHTLTRTLSRNRIHLLGKERRKEKGESVTSLALVLSLSSVYLFIFLVAKAT